jgi:hypothetical protein
MEEELKIGETYIGKRLFDFAQKHPNTMYASEIRLDCWPPTIEAEYVIVAKNQVYLYCDADSFQSDSTIIYYIRRIS